MRLIKSEFFNGYQYGPDYYECFKNPTYYEWLDIIDKTKYKGARGIIERNGTLYIWNENLLHEKALSAFGMPDGIHFNIEPAGIYIYITQNVNMNILRESFSKASALYNYLGEDHPVAGINTTWYSADTDPYYKEIEKISDILKYEPVRELVTMEKGNMVMSRLRKLASRYEVSFSDLDDKNKVEEFWANSKEEAEELAKEDYGKDIIIKKIKKLF